MATTDHIHAEMMRKIHKRAREAFGPEAAEDWMSRRWRIFDHKTPLELAQTDPKRVKRFIDQMNASSF